MRNMLSSILILSMLMSCNSGSKKSKSTSNEVRIHDIWAAVRIEGYPINRMVTVPRLEVNTTEMKIFGNDGCNSYFGTISEISDSMLILQNIGTTGKMCPNMEIPDRYLSAISKVEHYEFIDNLLVLSDRENNELLAFMKVD